MCVAAGVMVYAAAFLLGACGFALACVTEQLYRRARADGTEAEASGGSEPTTTPPQPLRSLRNIKLTSLADAGLTAKRIPLLVLGGALTILCFLWLTPPLAALTVTVFFCVLAAIALVDQNSMLIPNGLCVAVAVLGLISLFTLPGMSLLEHLIGICAVSVPLALIALIVPGGFGGGDIKLMAAGGLLLGWKLVLLSGFIAIILGGVYGIVLLATKKKDRHAHFAFGPFLCIGMVVGCLFGNQIIGLYLSMIL